MGKEPVQVPTTIDGIIKAALRSFHRELAEWILGEKPRSVEEIDSAQAAVAQRFTDRLLLLRFKKKPAILLHLEFQREGDPSMPKRMAEYAALVFASLSRRREETFLPACAVIYLDRKRFRGDPGMLKLEGPFGFRLEVNYRVIKLWELDPAPILAMESPGLCPFVPLMAGNCEELLVESTRKIRQASRTLIPVETKRALLALTAGLGSLLIKDKVLLGRILSEIRWERITSLTRSARKGRLSDSSRESARAGKKAGK